MEPRDLQRHRTRLSGHEAKDARFVGLDLRNAVAQKSTWQNCTFDAVKFSLSALGDALFDSCTFIRCDFRQAMLVSRVHRTRFEACDFDQTNFTGSWITESEFKRCRAQYSVWERASLYDTKLDCDLRGADLNFSITKNVDFTGSNLWAARIPMSCAGLFGNTFDDRQIGGLLALLETANLPAVLGKELRSIIPKRSRALVQRILRVQ